MTLEATVTTRFGRLDLDASVSIGAEELVVLLGPNGAGKTTFLRALAGLIAIDRGAVYLDGVTLEDSTTGVRVPPEKRRIGFVFQDHLLFPHLSVVDNVAFGLRARGMGRKQAHKQAIQWLQRLALGGCETLKPGALSGGQLQRVALARALAIEPRLLLLDEPFAALDVSARVELRRRLRESVASFGGARLLVTHDPLEALVLADRLVVLEEGRVTQTGTADDLRRRPRSPYVATFVGVNLFKGRAKQGRIELDTGAELVVANGTEGVVSATVHPHAVALFRNRPDGTPRNVWQGVVESVDPAGDRVRVRMSGRLPIVAEVTSAAAAELGVAEGLWFWVSIKATEVSVYPA